MDTTSLPEIHRHGPTSLRLFIGTNVWCISYATVVGYKGVRARTGIRRGSTYSTTTAKHMNAMGCKDWPQVSDSEFERIAGIAHDGRPRRKS